MDERTDMMSNPFVESVWNDVTNRKRETVSFREGGKGDEHPVNRRAVPIVVQYTS